MRLNADGMLRAATVARLKENAHFGVKILTQPDDRPQDNQSNGIVDKSGYQGEDSN
jgi:hypothetical protein